MLQALVRTANRWVRDLGRSWAGPAGARAGGEGVAHRKAAGPRTYLPLQRVLLTDGVARSLFEEYAAHRSEVRGEEETGWILLGLREADEAVVLATLRAGTQRDAGVAHVLFNSSAQAVASCVVRQADRRLFPVGVVHTHPGSLRHPSDGDWRGDSQWLHKVPRGREAVFGIGTADGVAETGTLFAYQPRPHVQCLGELRFSWYVLGRDEPEYRTIPVEITIGPDLARPLHSLWAALEAHAERILRLYRQQAGLKFEVIADEWGPGLVLHFPLADPGDALRVLVRPKEVRYHVVRGGEVFLVDLAEECLDRGVYLLLAELAARA